MRTTTNLAAGLVLAVGLLAGCSGSDGSDGEAAAEQQQAPPTDAAQQDFCDTYAGLFTNLAQMDPQDARSGVEAVRTWAGEMEEVGTPAGIPAEARQGFEVMVETLQEIDADATEEELAELGDQLGQGDRESGQAFLEYATTECPDAMKGLLGGLEDQMGELPELTETPGG